MKFDDSTLPFLLLALHTAHGFQPRCVSHMPSAGTMRRFRNHHPQLHQAPPSSSSPDSQADAADYHRFDYLLQESEGVQIPTISRRRVAVGGDNERTVLLASSTTGAFPGSPTQRQMVDDDDPYAIDSRVTRLEKLQEQAQTNTLQERLKAMDFQDVVITLAVPSLLAFVSGRWIYNRIAGRVGKSADESLDRFAKEMIAHDGDIVEMKLCIADYKKKLVWMGPKRNDALLKQYLEQYAKKKTVSPQAIVTLSNVFPLFGYTEAKAAELLVSLCNQMGTSKISSAGKLLFFGNHIFKTAEGRAALKPIRDLIMSTYRDVNTAAAMIDSSQQYVEALTWGRSQQMQQLTTHHDVSLSSNRAMAEAAYRATVQAGGKNQSKLTAGWQLLGLNKATANRIFEEQKEEGFVSDREAMYSGQTRKYDKKGRQIRDDGKLANPEEADADEGEEEEQEAMSNVYECGQCGFTLFIAEGRESKFYGSDFKCPECGAPKSEFKARGNDSD
jgi:rubrerythrin